MGLLMACINKIIKTLNNVNLDFPMKDYYFLYISLYLISMSIFLNIFFPDPLLVTTYYMRAIFVYKVRVFTAAWKNKIILKRDFNT